MTPPVLPVLPGPPDTSSLAGGQPRAGPANAAALLSGRTLLLARTGAGFLTAVTVLVFVVGLQAQLVLLRQPCPSANCQDGRLPGGSVSALQSLGFSLDAYATYTVALTVALAVVYGTVALVIVSRRSNDRMALFASMALLVFGLVTFSGIPPTLAVVHPALFVPVQVLAFGGSVAFGTFLYLFPAGRFVPRWTRWVLLGWIVSQALEYIFPVSPLPAGIGVPLTLATWVVFLGTCIYGQIYRYRYVSSPDERQRTKWVVFGVSIALVGFLGLAIVAGYFFSPEALTSPQLLLTELLATLVFYGMIMLIPVSIGVAILRYQLFDIDVLINRALVYGSLTALLTGTLVVLYIGIVLVLQALLRALTGPGAQESLAASTLAIAVSTLAVAALFQPLRRRLQSSIDRRFYRRKYDLARTLEVFSGSLRREVDVVELGERLVSVVRDTMQPALISLWLPAGEPPGDIERVTGDEDAGLLVASDEAPAADADMRVTASDIPVGLAVARTPPQGGQPS